MNSKSNQPAHIAGLCTWLLLLMFDCTFCDVDSMKRNLLKWHEPELLNA